MILPLEIVFCFILMYFMKVMTKYCYWFSRFWGRPIKYLAILHNAKLMMPLGNQEYQRRLKLFLCFLFFLVTKEFKAQEAGEMYSHLLSPSSLEELFYFAF